MCCDPTVANTGCFNRPCVLLEQKVTKIFYNIYLSPSHLGTGCRKRA